MDKLQFIVLIFAVLLSKLCNVLLCVLQSIFQQFTILKTAAPRDIRLSKIKNSNFTPGAGDYRALLCQISSISVKRLQRYGELKVFKVVAVRHLGLFKNSKF